MSPPPRVETGGPPDAESEDGQFGHARGVVDEAGRTLAALRHREQDLRKQIAAVDAENRLLERELMQQLSQWRRLDDATQRVEDVLPQLKAVTGSLTYRLVAGMFGVVNRVRRAILPGRR